MSPRERLPDFPSSRLPLSSVTTRSFWNSQRRSHMTTDRRESAVAPAPQQPQRSDDSACCVDASAAFMHKSLREMPYHPSPPPERVPNGDQLSSADSVHPPQQLLGSAVCTVAVLEAASTSHPLDQKCPNDDDDDDDMRHVRLKTRHSPRSSSSSSNSNRSSSSLRASLLSTSGSVPLFPHSKSLVLDPESNGAVLQAAVSSGAEVVEVVAEQSWLITKLLLQLLWALRMSRRWILCALRLVSFVVVLLFPLVRIALYWFASQDVHKNIIYGRNRRNLLDVYTVPRSAHDDATASATEPAQRSPPDARAPSNASFMEKKHPVVVFVSGGAWIIGYKAWGALMGRVLASLGVVVVMPDYRNFPQGVVPDMVEDVTRAMQWVFDNVHLFGGDRSNVHLIGQSAGAHLALCALLEQVDKKRNAAASSTVSPTASVTSGTGDLSDCESLDSMTPLTQPITWTLRHVRSYIGISGPYNMEASIATFHRHGFDRAVVERIMAHQLAYYSPSLRLAALSELPLDTRTKALEDFPPCFLFHGTADKTVNYRSSEQLTAALRACNVPVSTRFFEGKTHTDPIIEDPIVGDDFLLDDVMAALNAQAPLDPISQKPRYELRARPHEGRYYPKVLVRLARAVNPF